MIKILLNRLLGILGTRFYSIPQLLSLSVVLVTQAVLKHRDGQVKLYFGHTGGLKLSKLHVIWLCYLDFHLP